MKRLKDKQVQQLRFMQEVELEVKAENARIMQIGSSIILINCVYIVKGRKWK